MSVLSGDGGKVRLQELVGDDLVVTDSVLKMRNAFSSMRVGSFKPRQIQVGGVEGRQSGEMLRRLLYVQDPFAAFLHGDQGGGIRGGGI